MWRYTVGRDAVRTRKWRGCLWHPSFEVNSKVSKGHKQWNNGTMEQWNNGPMEHGVCDHRDRHGLFSGWLVGGGDGTKRIQYGDSKHDCVDGSRALRWGRMRAAAMVER